MFLKIVAMMELSKNITLELSRRAERGRLERPVMLALEFDCDLWFDLDCTEPAKTLLPCFHNANYCFGTNKT